MSRHIPFWRRTKKTTVVIAILIGVITLLSQRLYIHVDTGNGLFGIQFGSLYASSDSYGGAPWQVKAGWTPKWYPVLLPEYSTGAGFWSYTMIPLWPFVVISIGVAMFAHCRCRPVPGYCSKCGYDLSGIESGACPECGMTPAASSSSPPTP